MQDPLGPLRVVRAHPKALDPAIDVKAMGKDLDEYRRTRDESLLKFHDGMQPVWFELRPLPASYAYEALDNPAIQGRLRDVVACRAGLTRVLLPNGDVLAPDPKQTVQTMFDFDLAGEEWIDRLVRKFGGHTPVEMGRIAHERAMLPEEARGPFSCPAG